MKQVIETTPAGTITITVGEAAQLVQAYHDAIQDSLRVRGQLRDAEQERDDYLQQLHPTS
jgi:hypothetical protein